MTATISQCAFPIHCTSIMSSINRPAASSSNPPSAVVARIAARIESNVPSVPCPTFADAAPSGVLIQTSVDWGAAVTTRRAYSNCEVLPTECAGAGASELASVERAGAPIEANAAVAATASVQTSRAKERLDVVVFIRSGYRSNT